MSIKIRSSVFETNSSSVHAMIITKGETNPSDNAVNFGFGEYGWEEREYHDVCDKANYFYTAAYDIYGEDIKYRIENVLSKYGIKCRFASPSIGRLFEECYVDHSYDAKDFVDAMLDNPDMFVRFLFNEDSFIHTGNDNSEMEWFDVVHNTEYPHDEFVKGN